MGFFKRKKDIVDLGSLHKKREKKKEELKDKIPLLVLIFMEIKVIPPDWDFWEIWLMLPNKKKLQIKILTGICQKHNRGIWVPWKEKEN